MADQLILRALDGSPEAERILGEFEQRTGLRPDVQGADRCYELHDSDHHARIIQTLTAIDPSWTDHLGLRMPG